MTKASVMWRFSKPLWSVRQARAVAVVLALSSVSGALAHHSPSAFDLSRQVIVEGTLARIDWANPLIYLTVETATPNGQRALQQIEAVSISAAQSTGLTREVLALGSPVVVRAHPNRRGAGFTVLGADITMNDGTTFALGGTGRTSRPPVATVPATGLGGNWAPKANPLLVPTVQGWPLTAKARAALAAIAGGNTITIGCTPVPPPMIMQLPQLRSLDIGAERVLMRLDADGVDATRIVHLDLAAHPAGVEPSVLGHSIGRWEGDTLVIDTVAFTPHPLGVGFGVPGGSRKHLVERLTLAGDGLQLRYDLMLEDPEHLAVPVTYTAMWDHRPDLTPSAVACDPEIAERYRND